ncbi:neuropeptide FF receptor 1-like [Stylophora pistillata]|uniref:neuropeptide FF receptor 1-like n=1 Tax=Stylophora pistillata TaxID=50429 RepID=UPI000C049A00|nr:neuropeptide FF receptor 1-like [Stylophora pistillata]
MSSNVTATMNRTHSMSSCFNPIARRISESFAYSLLFVVSLAANTFIGIIVYRTKALRTPINILIVNMAISELLHPIFMFTRTLVELNMDNYWLISGHLGQALCKLSHFATDVSTAVSIQSLLLIAVNRFVAVVFPHCYPLISSKRCRFFILVIWIFAMAVHCPYLIAFRVVEYSKGLFCQWQWKEAFGESISLQTYISVMELIVVFCYVPLVVIIILYFAIALKTKSQKVPGEQSAAVRVQCLRREREIFFLAYSYCTVNPCICFIFSGNFRQGLKNLLSCSSTD